MVVNAGQNIAEAINFCLSEWENFVPIEECPCIDSTDPTDTGYPGVQEEFNIRIRPELDDEDTAGDLCFKISGHGAYGINSGK